MENIRQYESLLRIIDVHARCCENTRIAAKIHLFCFGLYHRARAKSYFIIEADNYIHTYFVQCTTGPLPSSGRITWVEDVYVTNAFARYFGRSSHHKSKKCVLKHLSSVGRTPRRRVCTRGMYASLLRPKACNTDHKLVF